MLSPCFLLIFSNTLHVFRHVLVNTASYWAACLLLLCYAPSTVFFIQKENITYFALNFEMYILQFQPKPSNFLTFKAGLYFILKTCFFLNLYFAILMLISFPCNIYCHYAVAL